MSPARRRRLRACVCGRVTCQHGRSGWTRHKPPANAYAYGGYWARIRLQVLERDDYQCQLRYADICVGRASQVDHIVQPEAGGTNDLSNLRAVCVKCHRRRTGQQGALEKQHRSKHLRSRKEK